MASAANRKAAPTMTPADLPPLLQDLRTSSKIRAPSPASPAKPGSRKASALKLGPEALHAEAETLGAVAKKLGVPLALKTTSSTTPHDSKVESQRKVTQGPAGIPANKPPVSKYNRLELPFSSKRPVSAPNAVDSKIEPNLEEAKINASFLGTNLKAKKAVKENKTVVEKYVFTLQDFEIHEQIGKGAFARVHVAKFKNSDSENYGMTSKQLAKTYAMKSLRKADIVKTKQIKHVMSEKNILSLLKHPFIVDLVTTFQDPKHLYLILEYIPGGDMFSHIRKHVRFPESIARFYTCEILLALEYIHSKDVVYRDLKPENILIDPLGHIKIADFGFAKVIPRNHATTFCGTPAYMAPEIIMKLGYTKGVDWWSLGTVCYELMAGYSPFQAESPLRIYERILNMEMRWSSQIGDTAKDLLSKLLETQPNRRLGYNGAKEIKSHSWFKGINWKAVESCTVVVPFVPKVDGDGDIKNFDIYTDQSSVIEMQNGSIKLTSEDNLYDGMFPDF